MAATPASALQVTAYNGDSYSLETITGRFDELENRITSQDWWRDQSLAEELAYLVGFDLGQFSDYPGYSFGPSFGYGMDDYFDDTVNLVYLEEQGPEIGLNFTLTRARPSGTGLNVENTWVVESLATPGDAIPTPALVPGLIGMSLAALRKRNQQDS